MNYSGMLIKMFVFVILLMIGYFSSKREVLGEGYAKSTSWLLQNIFLPAAILNSVIGERPELPQNEVWGVMLILTVLMLMVYVISYAAARLLGKDGQLPQWFLLISTMNTLYVGIPVLQSLCGSEAVFYAGLSCIPYNILLYTVGTGLLRHGKSGGGFSFRSMLSPALTAALTSLLIFAFNIKVPSIIKELISTTAAATVPVSMILIGATIGKGSIADAFKDRKILLVSAVRLVLTPLAARFLLRPLISSDVLLAACVVIAACPSATLCTPLSIQYGYDGETSSKTILVTTVLSMAAIPALIYVLF